MKRITFFLSLIVLMGVLTMTACSATIPEPTTAINSPAVTATVSETDVEIRETETTTVETQASTPTTGSPEATKTQTSTLPQTDDEWRAFITEKLQGHHTLDFLLAQKLSEQEWLDVLARRSHADVVLTQEEKTAMIQWLMSN